MSGPRHFASFLIHREMIASCTHNPLHEVIWERNGDLSTTLIGSFVKSNLSRTRLTALAYWANS